MRLPSPMLVWYIDAENASTSFQIRSNTWRRCIGRGTCFSWGTPHKLQYVVQYDTWHRPSTEHMWRCRLAVAGVAAAMDLMLWNGSSPSLQRQRRAADSLQLRVLPQLPCGCSKPATPLPLAAGSWQLQLRLQFARHPNAAGALPAADSAAASPPLFRSLCNLPASPSSSQLHVHPPCTRGPMQKPLQQLPQSCCGFPQPASPNRQPASLKT
jgi:hypothetical protein